MSGRKESARRRKFIPESPEVWRNNSGHSAHRLYVPVRNGAKPDHRGAVRDRVSSLTRSILGRP